MVSYCCVKGCHNNTSEKRKKVGTPVVTFHAFPTNASLKAAWLTAIGCPSWDPPNHARICSIHFTESQINREHARTRLTQLAVPLKALPKIVLTNVLSVKACRFCLKTDIKMFSMQIEELKTSAKLVFGQKKEEDMLPNYTCYICANRLKKCSSFIENTNKAHMILQELYSSQGVISTELLRNEDFNLHYSLDENKVLPAAVLEFSHNESTGDSNFVSKCCPNIKPKIQKAWIPKQTVTPQKPRKVLKQENVLEISNSNIVKPNDQVDDDDPFIYNLRTEESCYEQGVSDDLDFAPLIDATDKQSTDDEEMDEKPLSTLKRKRKVKTENEDDNKLTAEELNLQEYFHIVTLTPQEQIEDRQKMKESTDYRDALHKCSICYRSYLHPNAFDLHMLTHDPSRGESECPVCKIRLKSDVIVKLHVKRAHSKKFSCKTCPKVFRNVSAAKRHKKGHDGYVYKCKYCDFESVHESAHKSHLRSTHGFVPNGEALKSPLGLYACSRCGVSLGGAAVWRQHVLSDGPHLAYRRANQISTATLLRRTCKLCTKHFSDTKKLRIHYTKDHQLQVDSDVNKPWGLTEVNYPIDCEHCGERLMSRGSHYAHVRSRHPRLRDSYRPLIAAVCDTCGKGFQNKSKLHLHSLRHAGAQAVSCPHCPRLFYDKFQLQRHVIVHSDVRPYVCTLCSKAFKFKTSLDRHHKVHSGKSSYECTLCGKSFRYSSSRNLHVRTVHLRLPAPPRKKKPPTDRDNAG